MEHDFLGRVAGCKKAHQPLTNPPKDGSIIFMTILISLIGAYIQMIEVTA
jgi:hypothetical protein